MREILYRLEYDKLVSIMSRAGTMITLVEFQKLRDVFQVRVSVEGLIGGLAAERISNDQLREMQKIQEECKSLSADEDTRQLVNIDIKFREVLNGSANNQILKEISDYLYNLTLRVWYKVFEKNTFFTEVEGEIKEIEETIQVLSKRDSKEAEQFRRNVIINYVERVRNSF